MAEMVRAIWLVRLTYIPMRQRYHRACLACLGRTGSKPDGNRPQKNSPPPELVSSRWSGDPNQETFSWLESWPHRDRLDKLMEPRDSLAGPIRGNHNNGPARRAWKNCEWLTRSLIVRVHGGRGLAQFFGT